MTRARAGAGAVRGWECFVVDFQEMVDFSYMQSGLAGLSRAHRGGGMAGHLGGALLAGYFFSELKSDLDPGVYLGIERDLERVMRGEEDFWFDPKKKGITIPELFEPLPKGGTVSKTAKKDVAEALRQSIAKTRQSGHNVIFGSLAIRALDSHPELATDGVADGLIKLLATFTTVGPGKGYRGVVEGWKQGDFAGDGAHGYDSIDAMAEATLDYLIAHAHEHRQGFGGPFHLIDHAAGLIDLSQCGIHDLAEEGLPAHRQHLRLLEQLPVLDEELGALKKSDKTPFDPAYWAKRKSEQWSADLTHRIKVLYGYEIVKAAVDNEEKCRAADLVFPYLMA